jgi:aquaporin Z
LHAHNPARANWRYRETGNVPYDYSQPNSDSQHHETGKVAYLPEINTSLQSTLLAYICEFWGTFCLVFIGTGAIIVNDLTSSVTNVGVALTFGLVVMVIIYCIGHLSGAHINPAVSIGFFAVREIGIGKLVSYIAVQMAGAISASVVLRLIFFENETLGATLPNDTVTGINPVVACICLEFLLTFILMLVILAMTTKANVSGHFTGLAVGAVIGMEALAFGPICGASMNPARSIGPALVSGNLQYLWIYITAPIAGTLAASLLSPLLIGSRSEFEQ